MMLLMLILFVIAGATCCLLTEEVFQLCQHEPKKVIGELKKEQGRESDLMASQKGTGHKCSCIQRTQKKKRILLKQVKFIISQRMTTDKARTEI